WPALPTPARRHSGSRRRPPEVRKTDCFRAGEEASRPRAAVSRPDRTGTPSRRPRRTAPVRLTMPSLKSNRPRHWFGELAIPAAAGRLGAVAVGGLLACWPLACNAPGYMTGTTKANPNQREGANIDPNVQIYTDGPVGWASVNDLGQDGTTGGG